MNGPRSAGRSSLLDDALERIAPVLDEPHLESVRDGLAALAPLLTVGSMAMLLQQLPLPAWQAHLAAQPDLAAGLRLPFDLTYGLLALYAVASIAYHLAKRRGLEPLWPAGLAVLSLAISLWPIQADETASLAAARLDYRGLFPAIVVALLSVEAYGWFMRRGLVLSVPSAVPPPIAHLLEALAPTTVFAAIVWTIRVLAGLDLGHAVTSIATALVPAASSFLSSVIAETTHAVLWVLGIHGDLTVGSVLQPVWTSNLAANAAAHVAGQRPPWIYTEMFRSYVAAGGSGGTLPLALYLLRSGSARLRVVGRHSVLACFFNINEPLIFGAPIVFNPLLALPFVGITAINTIVAYLAHSLDWVSATVAFVPWILPTPVLTFLASSYDVRAGMLGLVTWLIIPGIVWLPFFRRWEQQVIAAESA